MAPTSAKASLFEIDFLFFSLERQVFSRSATTPQHRDYIGPRRTAKTKPRTYRVIQFHTQNAKPIGQAANNPMIGTFDAANTSGTGVTKSTHCSLPCQFAENLYTILDFFLRLGQSPILPLIYGSLRLS
jgi:hypothetical protein